MTSTPTTEQKITVLKHAVNGKPTTVIETVTGLSADQVRQTLTAHGYPAVDKMQWAIDILTTKSDQVTAAALISTEPLTAGRPVTAPVDQVQPRTIPTTPAAGGDTRTPPAAPLTKPDEIRVLLNTAKASTSKRIQGLANKVLDDVARLRDLVHDDQVKTQDRLRVEQEKAAARAEAHRQEAPTGHLEPVDDHTGRWQLRPGRRHPRLRHRHRPRRPPRGPRVRPRRARRDLMPPGIPCKHPRVRVNELLGRDRVAAVCDVPTCGWRYENGVLSDVREQATRHRTSHRDLVPKTWVVRDPEWDAHCSGHGTGGSHRRTLPTRAHALAWLRHHLVEEHGLVDQPPP